MGSSFILVLLTYDILIKDHLTETLRGVAFPVQLICVMVGTMISQFLNLKEHPTNLRVIGEVPTG